MIARAVGGLVRKPGRAVLLSARTARELGRATRNPVLVAAANQVRASLRGPLGAVLNIGRARDDEGGALGPLPVAHAATHTVQRADHPAPALRLPVDAARAVKDVKNALGATVNDVVMAVCAGGLRTWLDEHDALPDGPLVAMVPVSIRTGEEERALDEPGVGDLRLAARPTSPTRSSGCARSTRPWSDAKQLFDAVPAETLTDFAQFPPPAVFAQAMRTATRLTGRFGTPVNLVISNVPGPREPLYAAGSKLLHYYPVSDHRRRAGSQAVQSSSTPSTRSLRCRELVPDLWDMVDAIVDDLDALAKPSGVDELKPEAKSDHPIPHEARCDSLTRPSGTPCPPGTDDVVGQGLGDHLGASVCAPHRAAAGHRCAWSERR